MWHYKDFSLLIHLEVFCVFLHGLCVCHLYKRVSCLFSLHQPFFFFFCRLPPPEHAKASLPLIISVNLWLSLGAGQWLTTLPVSQTLITAQVTHRPGNDWLEMETSLILWAPELKWNISWGERWRMIRGLPVWGWNCGGPSSITFLSLQPRRGTKILLARIKDPFSILYAPFSSQHTRNLPMSRIVTFSRGAIYDLL